MFKTAVHVAIASEYERDMYTNSLVNVQSNTISCEETIFYVLHT